mgnify:FL=1
MNAAGKSLFSNKVNAKSNCKIIPQVGYGFEKQVDAFRDLKVYPNPSANGMFGIHLPATVQFPVYMRLLSTDGKIVLSSELKVLHSTIYTGGVSKGIYLLHEKKQKENKQVKIQIR